MSLKVEILESDTQINSKIKEAITTHLLYIFNKNIPKAESKLKTLINNWILSQPEVDSLLTQGSPGSLNAQFGLRSGDAKLATLEIVDILQKGIKIEIGKISKNLNGNINIYIDFSVFNEILSLDSGFVITEKNQSLHWMDWILNQGTKTIIFGYNYKADFSGRSGGGTMKKGSVWRINPVFAGTTNNNFITRAFENREKDIQSVFEELLND